MFFSALSTIGGINWHDWGKGIGFCAEKCYYYNVSKDDPDRRKIIKTSMKYHSDDTVQTGYGNSSYRFVSATGKIVYVERIQDG